MRLRLGDKFYKYVPNSPRALHEVVAVDPHHRSYTTLSGELYTGYQIHTNITDEELCSWLDTGWAEVVPTQGVQCWHDWDTYRGFTHWYHFCRKCGMKQEIPWTARGEGGRK